MIELKWRHHVLLGNVWAAGKHQSGVYHSLEDWIFWYVFFKVSLDRPSFFPGPYSCPTIKRRKESVSSLWGNAGFCSTPVVAGQIFQGRRRMWLRCQQLALWITEIVGAAGGATVSNGSLVLLDVEIRDPLADSPQLEKAGSAAEIHVLSANVRHLKC